MGKSRYFIAVLLRGRALQEAEEIKAWLHARFGLKGALRSPAHITLHRPFEWKSTREAGLIRKLEEFKGGDNFELRLRGFDSFSKRVIYVDVAPSSHLKDLHDRLKKFARKELGLLNEAEDERGFHPHVTVAFRDLRRRHFDDVWGALTERQPIDDTQLVSGFSLLRLDDQWREIFYFDWTKPHIYK